MVMLGVFARSTRRNKHRGKFSQFLDCNFWVSSHSMMDCGQTDSNSSVSYSDEDVKNNSTSTFVHTTAVTQVNIGDGRPYPPELPDREPWRVDFSSNDPLNAKNWPLNKKLASGLSIGYTAIVCGCGSSIFSSATAAVSEEFDVSVLVANLGTSLFIAGFASGPIFWGPLSEVYGRRWPILIATFGGALFNIAAATGTNFQTIMICRFFAGFISAAPVSVGGGAFSDMFDAYGRGIAMVLFTASIFIFPILIPIAGSFITIHSDWRWVQYLVGIMGFLAVIIDFFYLHESYAPVLLCQKAKQLRNATGNWGLYAPHEYTEFNFKTVMTKTIARPLRMLCREPILLLVSVYTAFIYGMFYLYLEAYPIVFHNGYKMPRNLATLPYIGLAIGMIIGTVLIIFVFEPLRRTNNNSASPKSRLPPSMIGGVLFPIGIFWLFWTGNFPETIHWMVPTSSGIFTGIGTILIMIPCTNYVVDTYVPVAASALAANACLRSGFGAAFPMFACTMFTDLGDGISGTIIGAIAALFMPVPLIFYKFDQQIRSKSKYALS